MVRTYREELARYVGMRQLEVWYSRVDASTIVDMSRGLARYRHPGRRVVNGQRLLQTASDMWAWPAAPAPSTPVPLALKDVTAVGILSASPGLEATIQAYASGAVDPRPLVAATVGLDQVGPVLAGQRPQGAGPDPRSTSTHGTTQGPRTMDDFTGLEGPRL